MPTFNSAFMPDNYEKSFDMTEEEEFIAEIRAMEEAGHWEDFKTGDLGGVRMYLGPMFLDEAIREARDDIHHNAVIDSVDGSGLFLQTASDYGFDDDEVNATGAKRDCIPLRQAAIRQLINTALAVSDEMQNKDEVSDPAFFCNLFKAIKGSRYRENRVNQLWICAGKITAVGSSDYCKMPIDEVFGRVVPAIRETFPTLNFESGYNSFAYTKALYEIGGNEEEELRQKYEAMVNRPGRTTRAIPGMKFTVTVQTSNAKSSAAILTPIIVSDTGARIPVGNPLRVDHKHRPEKEGIELLVDKAPEVFAKFGDPKSRFADMSDTVINYPKDCLVNLCKRAGLPQKLVGMCVDDLEACLNGAGTCSMFDVYLSICQMTSFAEAEDYPVQTVDTIEEGIARILGYRWTDSDRRSDV